MRHHAAQPLGHKSAHALDWHRHAADTPPRCLPRWPAPRPPCGPVPPHPARADHAAGMIHPLRQPKAAFRRHQRRRFRRHVQPIQIPPPITADFQAHPQTRRWRSAQSVAGFSCTMALVMRVVPWTKRRKSVRAQAPPRAMASNMASTGASGRDGTLAVRVSRVPAMHGDDIGEGAADIGADFPMIHSRVFQVRSVQEFFLYKKNQKISIPINHHADAVLSQIDKSLFASFSSEKEEYCRAMQQYSLRDRLPNAAHVGRNAGSRPAACGYRAPAVRRRSPGCARPPPSRPFCSTTRSSHSIRTTFRSWLTNSKAMSSSRRSRSSNCRITAWIDTSSSAAVGSSRTSNFGPGAMARAMPTRAFLAAGKADGGSGPANPPATRPALPRRAPGHPWLRRRASLPAAAAGGRCCRTPCAGGSDCHAGPGRRSAPGAGTGSDGNPALGLPRSTRPER